jgi:predicted DNA-binding transcriptional regulator AlpA
MNAIALKCNQQERNSVHSPKNENKRGRQMMLSAKEAALFLSVKPSWIYLQVKGNRIPFHTLPSSKGNRKIVRFIQSELEDWVKNNGQKEGGNELQRPAD